MRLLRGLLFDNLGLKLAALLLAVVVYLNVFTERPASMVVTFPLQFTDLADTLSLAGPMPAPVQAELRGTGKQLIRLWLTEPRIKVSLAGVGPGRFQRQVTVDDLPLMPSDQLEVQRVIGPSLLDLKVERKVTRRLAVAPRVSGTPQAGARWPGSVIADPSVVTLTGPQKALAALDSVALQPVSIGGRRDTVRAQAQVAELPAGCSAEPPTVAVTIPLERP
jgi:YbbR domain-containing protein